MLDNIAWICSILGGVVFLVGYMLRAPDKDLERRRLRVLATPTTPIAKARKGVVAIAGRVVAGPGELITAPFSQRQVAWVKLSVDETHHTMSTPVNGSAFHETLSCPFLIEDASGERALVSLEGLPEIKSVLIAEQADGVAAPESALDYLTANGVAAADGRRLFYEAAIAPGDAIFVIGSSVEKPGQDTPRLHIAATDTEELLFARSRELLVASFAHDKAGWVLTLAGGAVLVVGIIAFMMELAK